MMTEGKTVLVLLTGFLGSGKTTVLNDALAELHDKRVAVVVNEWGKQGVDGALLDDPSGIGITEIAGGQIFCSCVAGTFIKAIERLVSMKLDLILVETSGLAKPATLAEFVAELQKRAAGKLDYAGMTCVVDASRYPTLKQVVNAVNEQVAYADSFVIAKADLVDEKTLAGIREDLHRERPGAPIFERQGETLGASVILKGLPVSSSGALLIKPPIKASEDRWTGWGEDGRPRSLSIVPDSAVEKVKLEAFLGHIADKTHRMKGFVDVVGEDSMLVDCVGDQIQIRKVALAEGKAQTKREKALVIIWKASAIPEAELEELWLNMTATKAKAAV